MEGIVIQNVSQSFSLSGSQKQVLKNVSFTLKHGECIALTGESGSGKSTIARLILGLMPISSGEIYIDEIAISSLKTFKWKEIRKKVQGVFQDTTGSLNPYLSTYRNMEEALKNLTDMTRKMRKKELITLLNKLEISEDLLHTPVSMLSGGEQRRIALLRALSVRPKYLILDEVISGLDIISCDAVLTTLEDYKEQYGCSYLFITHDLNSAYRIADRILNIENGQIDRVIQKKK